MKNKLDYIGNARIINARDLPKIGESHPDKLLKNFICIELKIISFVNDFIIYQAKFCEKDSLHILDDFYINCASWSYAIKNTDKENHEKLYNMEV